MAEQQMHGQMEPNITTCKFKFKLGAQKHHYLQVQIQTGPFVCPSCRKKAEHPDLVRRILREHQDCNTSSSLAGPQLRLRFRFRFCLLFNRFTTREVELEDAIRGQQGLGFTHMYTRWLASSTPLRSPPSPYKGQSTYSEPGPNSRGDGRVSGSVCVCVCE